MCGARYKTRPGLTYHYGHSHKEGASDENSRESNAPNPSPQVGLGAPQAVNSTASPAVASGAPVLSPLGGGGMGGSNMSVGETAPTAPSSQGHVYQDSYVSFLNHPAGTALIIFYFQFIACMCRWHDCSIRLINSIISINTLIFLFPLIFLRFLFL